MMAMFINPKPLAVQMTKNRLSQMNLIGVYGGQTSPAGRIKTPETLMAPCGIFLIKLKY